MTAESITVPQMFLKTVAEHADKTALRHKHLGAWQDVTWADYLERVRGVALGLTSLGTERGDRVAVMAKNRPEWLYSDVGTMSMGGATVAIHKGSPPNQCEYVIGHSDARVFIVEDDADLEKVLTFRDKTPNLERIVVMDPKEQNDFSDQMVITFDALRQKGRALGEKEPGLFYELVNRSQPEDMALINYVPVSEGPPRGAMLSHENITWTTRSFGQAVAFQPSDELVSSLPLSHAAERVFTGFLPLRFGHTVNFADNPATLLADLCEISPSVIFTVPRVWEKFFSAVKNLPPDAAKENLGLNRCRVALTGAADISSDVFEYYQGIGVPLRQGYGLTECTGVACTHRDQAIETGNVGQALPGVEVRIAEDGEVLIKGPNVFLGYYRDPEATKEIMKAGRLCSGDVGELDERGFLSLTGKKKDLIIKAGGKNISPQGIENKIKAGPYISDAVLVGDGRKFLSVLIALDEENTARYARENNIPFSSYESLAETPEIRDLVDKEMEKVNETLHKAEMVKKSIIVPGKLYDEEGGTTPTIQAKRKYVNEKFADLIEAIYKR